MLNTSYCKAWEAHKAEVREDLNNIIQDRGYIEDYSTILDSIIKRVLNQNPEAYTKFSAENVTVIGSGDYQGCLIWAIPTTIACTPHDYIFAYQYYGSCSVCDALLGAEKDLDELMQIALGMFESMKFLWER